MQSSSPALSRKRPRAPHAARGRALALSLLAVLPGCTSLGGTSPRHIARPGYECHAQNQENTAWAILDEDGEQVSASLEWRISTGQPLVWIQVRDFVQGRSPLRAADAFASIQWFRAGGGSGRPPTLRLELTSAPERRYRMSPVAFASEYERGGSSLMASWSDLVTYARGASRLTLIRRDRRRGIVDQAELEPRLFLDAEAGIVALLAGLGELSTDFRSRCQHVDDIDPEIILT
jgi:hypothetical protein